MLIPLYTSIKRFLQQTTKKVSVAFLRKSAYHRKMDKEQAIKLAGNANKLAAILGITRQAISQWGGVVPDARVWQLKVLRPEWFL